MVKTTATRSFNRLYEEHHRAVLSYFLRRIDRDSAYDATQDVYVIAWRRLDSIPDGEMELAWLYTVSRGVLSNYRRKQSRFSRMIRRLANQRSDSPSEPEPQVIQHFEYCAVLDALAGLTDRDQEVLRLAVWEELPHAEIGEILGCSSGAVDVRVHRALRRLAKAFDRSVLIPSERQVLLPGEEE